MKRLLMALVVLAVVLVPGSVRAGDAPGCEGLEQFRADIMPIGEKWADDLKALGVSDLDWDPLTMSSDDWQDYADIALSANRELKGIDTPDWAADWMAVQLDTTALQEQIGKAAAAGGSLAIIAFSSSIDTINQRDDESRKTTIAHCAEFAQFVYDWDALDGQIDGTPVPTPAR